MIVINWLCDDDTGVAAQFTEALWKAGVNIEDHDFEVVEGGGFRKKEIGSLLIVVRDEQGDKAEEAIHDTGEHYRLGVRELRQHFWVKMRFKDEPGALNMVLRKIAHQGIKLRKSKSLAMEGVPPNRTRIILVKIDCERVDYARAKSILGNCAEVLNEPTFVHPSFFDRTSAASYKA